jgi:hypothetical protein
MIRKNDKLAAALDYARRGWKVFPLAPRTKVPFEGSNGFKDATEDEEQIQKWWTENPDANVAIATGAVSGIDALDEDEEGAIEEPWASSTPLVNRSRPGRRQLIFRHTVGVKSETSVLPGVDVRGDGGYIVAPPSLHPETGEPYRWEGDLDAELPVFPKELLLMDITPKKGDLSDEQKKLILAMDRLAAWRAEDHDTWVQVGMICHHVSGGEDWGFALWEEWSKDASNFERGVCDKRWKSFHEDGNKTGTITLGTLLKWADEDEEASGLVWADEDPMADIDWLWPDRLPLGKLVGVVGEMEKGKGVFLADLAARLSRGDAFPDGTQNELGPTPTLWLGVEDDFDDTIKPRFAAAGGDFRYLVTRRVIRKKGVDRVLTFPDNLDVARRDLQRIEKKLGDRPGLIVLDPWDAFLSDDINAWSAKDIRRALSPMAQLAQETGWCLGSIAHTNKNESARNPVYRVANSQAFMAAVRTAWLVGDVPDDNANGLRAFVRLKGNIIPRDVPGLLYEVVAAKHPLKEASRKGKTVPVMKWGTETHYTAAEVLAGPATEKKSKTERAIDWLFTTLDGKGKVPADDIKDAAEKAGISNWSLRKAAKELRVRKESISGEDGKVDRWVWWMPDWEDGEEGP